MKDKIKWGIISVFLLASCTSSKDVLYLQDVEILKKEPASKRVEIIIQRDDLISIIVSSRNPELATPFNLQGGSSVLGYTVDRNGHIDFPVLGKIYVAGLTRIELQEMIKNKIITADYIKDPIVTAQFLNFKFSVLGEVGKPGSYQITGDHISLFEAISMAGDLTMYGRRDRIAIIRENDSTQTILYHDLRSSEVFNSPDYYLHQNDIIYVEPNKAKIQLTDRSNWSLWITGFSFVMSVSTFVMLFFK